MSLLYDDCRNASSLLVASCYGNGVCSYFNHSDTEPQWRCNCTGNYAAELNCEKTRFEHYGGVDVAIYIIFCIPMLVVAVMALIEAIFDVKFSTRPFKKPTIYGKIGLFLYSFAGAYGQIVAANTSLNNVLPSTQLQGIQNAGYALSNVSLGFTYALICMGWIRAVVHAKTLSNPVHLQRYRLFLLVMIAVLLPLYILLYVVDVLVTDDFVHSLVNYGIHGIEAIVVIAILSGSTYFLVKMLVWLSKQKTETFQKIYFKSKFLGVINVIMVLFLITAVLLALNPPGSRSLALALALEAVTYILSSVVCVCFYIFIANYLYQYGLFKGYYFGVRGKLRDRLTRSTVRQSTNRSERNKTKSVHTSTTRRSNDSVDDISHFQQSTTSTTSGKRPNTMASLSNHDDSQRETSKELKAVDLPKETEHMGKESLRQDEVALRPHVVPEDTDTADAERDQSHE